MGDGAATLQRLRVIGFDGGWNLPVWAGHRQGLFAAHGVNVQLDFTPNSGALVTGLLEGRYDIAIAALDNFVAYQEGQGEVPIPPDPDLFAFMGGDGGFLSVVAAPAVRTFGELAGKTLSVDALTTGFAFVLRELLARHRLSESDVTFVRAGATGNRYAELVAGRHDATLLRTPFELLAEAKGFRKLATAEALGAYQGSVGAARRSWAHANEAALVGFVRGYRAALEWLYDRANRAIAEALLVANLRDMTPALARQSCERLLADPGGLTRDAAIDLQGVDTVLALRSRYGQPAKQLADAARYVDTSFWRKAAAG
jgi:ABC-type nitrate/sulfonate/bicarbonate transport system substrate-binding protein